MYGAAWAPAAEVDVLVCGSRQDDLERCATAGALLDPGGAAMQLGQAHDQRESNSETGRWGADGVAVAEMLEHD
jgi:hypothetical protein